MINATQLRVGMTILFNNDPHRVLAVTHITPGNWRGMVQTKLKNLKTGGTTEFRFRSEDKVEKAHLDQREMEFLYSSGEDYHFMDTANYEQVSLPEDVLGDFKSYLTPNIKFTIEFYNAEPVGVEPPKVVELKVVDTTPYLKGATAAATQKPATLETGLVVNVPAFIQKGEVIRVDTSDGKYIERARA